MALQCRVSKTRLDTFATEGKCGKRLVRKVNEVDGISNAIIQDGHLLFTVDNATDRSELDSTLTNLQSVARIEPRAVYCLVHTDNADAHERLQLSHVFG